MHRGGVGVEASGPAAGPGAQPARPACLQTHKPPHRCPSFLAATGLDLITEVHKAAGDDYSYIMAEALADRLAEALAEKLHEVVRREVRPTSPHACQQHCPACWQCLLGLPAARTWQPLGKCVGGSERAPAC